MIMKKNFQMYVMILMVPILQAISLPHVWMVP